MFDPKNKVIVFLKTSLNIEKGLIFLIWTWRFYRKSERTCKSYMVGFRSVKFYYDFLIINSF